MGLTFHDEKPMGGVRASPLLSAVTVVKVNAAASTARGKRGGIIFSAIETNENGVVVDIGAHACERSDTAEHEQHIHSSWRRRSQHGGRVRQKNF
jgi:hypothetical protein